MEDVPTDGIWCIWWDEDRTHLRLEVSYNDGVLNGIYRSYNADGQRQREGYYENGLRVGIWRHWTILNTYQETEYREGVEHGLSRCWVSADQKQLLNEGGYENGEQTGVWRYWFIDGQLESEGRYEKNKVSGNWVFWHRQGNKHLEKHYFEGVIHGPVVSWYENGELEYGGMFKQGRQRGVWVFWNLDGTVRDIFDHGVHKKHNPHPCVIFKEPLDSGEEYLVCTFSDEHVHQYQFMLNFNQRSTMRCLYCQSPMSDVVYEQG